VPPCIPRADWRVTISDSGADETLTVQFVTKELNEGHPIGRQMSIQVKRVYEQSAKTDGVRFLVERLWPRGVKKEALRKEAWLKNVAPSDALRKWFAHDPKKWPEFQRRYAEELDANPTAWQPLLDAAREGDATLLYSAHDTEHNNAIALKAYLEARLRRR